MVVVNGCSSYYNINYAESIYRPVFVTADISHIYGGSLYSPSALSCSVIYVFFIGTRY